MVSDAISGHLALMICQATSCNYTTAVDKVTFIYLIIYLFLAGTVPHGPLPLHYLDFMITLRHITIHRTSLDERSARRRKFSVTKYNTHKRQTDFNAT
jgi:hypothetical protein